MCYKCRVLNRGLQNPRDVTRPRSSAPEFADVPAFNAFVERKKSLERRIRIKKFVFFIFGAAKNRSDASFARHATLVRVEERPFFFLLLFFPPPHSHHSHTSQQRRYVDFHGLPREGRWRGCGATPADDRGGDATRRLVERQPRAGTRAVAEKIHFCG